jgi:DNA polymerase II large subunit
MDTKEYFEALSRDFQKAYAVATEARGKGYDPEPEVEIRPAPDLAARVEGIMRVDGLADIIRAKAGGKSRPELAFEMVKEVCTSERFAGPTDKRLLLAVRIALSVLTEGILVAPTEGVQGVELHENPDGSDYAAILYAGPIRGAGGTAAALSVAFADSARRLLGVGPYKAQQSEIERYLEEIQLYNARVARLQYLPDEADIRSILENCPVCIDGLPSEQMEVNIRRNIMRLDAQGKPQQISNRIRSGVCLVSCEGIAQKAKSVLKHTKNAGLDWGWLNNVIRVEKQVMAPTDGEKSEKKEAVFLQELVAGRPVFAYPEHAGSFRLRYGRSRLTGIAAKGFSPATMHVLGEFIATGTQLKVEKPGKGCIAMPVDTIEGPFIKLETGEAFRINSAEDAAKYKGSIAKILSVGDILVTYGDFKKTNTPMLPSSYVEEYWYSQLLARGYKGAMPNIASFEQAYAFSKDYGVPMHPLYIYDYADAGAEALKDLAETLLEAKVIADSTSIFSLKNIEVEGDDVARTRETLERACVPHTDKGSSITIEGADAQSILSTLGFTKPDMTIDVNPKVLDRYGADTDTLEMLNAAAPFKVMRRSTHVGGRMGRPEKARERLMKPAPNVLFPVGEYGGKERNVSKAYTNESRKFDSQGIYVELARLRCVKGGEYIDTFYCPVHKGRAEVVYMCRSCGALCNGRECDRCSGEAIASETKAVAIVKEIDAAMSRVGLAGVPKLIKGVKGLVNGNKVAEPLEKGILRSINNVYIFKDGTARFDATDAPMTHFYPSEIGTPVEKLRALGYTKDSDGSELTSSDQLVELRHQDVVLNNRGAQYLLRVAKFVDMLLKKYYRMEPFYGAEDVNDLIGQYVVTLSPHTSAGVLGRIIGFTSSNVGLAHPYTISARRRNCDGDEDTTMLLLDALINFSRSYLPTTVGGTMDAPLILSVNIMPEEVDDEVHSMETVNSFGLDFYDKCVQYPAPGEMSVEMVSNRLGTDRAYTGLAFTHGSSATALEDSPKKSAYTTLKTMQDKITMQFELMDRLFSVDRRDTARRLILSHFIPDLMGNLHSYSKQTFRCVTCNSKYRRVPLMGKCMRCGGKLLLTISKGGIEKYLDTAIKLADRYDLETYIKQRVALLKDEIETVFGGIGSSPEVPDKQFNLSKFL